MLYYIGIDNNDKLRSRPFPVGFFVFFFFLHVFRVNGSPNRFFKHDNILRRTVSRALAYIILINAAHTSSSCVCLRQRTLLPVNRYMPLRRSARDFGDRTRPEVEIKFQRPDMCRDGWPRRFKLNKYFVPTSDYQWPRGTHGPLYSVI